MTRFVMICGTASHVGKSVLAAALCRLLVNRGVKVAPFKSQNMSLNSWVTKDGDEIGIAQAVQAWAAKIEPSADMNPVLLKPKGDTLSQVVLHGKPVGDKKAGDYYDATSFFLEHICDSLKILARAYEAIVMEGAGSPAEINLYEQDIANLRVARTVNAPVILVGDIERGGVFASLYGTVQLLPADDRKLIKGFIINKFRGDERLLERGLAQLERMTDIPVLGVIPFTKVRLPSEDSVSLGDYVPDSSGALEIAVIRLPHISNFTDFEPLETFVRVRYVSLDNDIGSPDAVIVPGTKNTVDDLRALRRSGMDKQIEAKAGHVPIIGICGGFQMLGDEIIDEGFESTQNMCKKIKGLQLLRAQTIFSSCEKKTKQVEKRVTGYGPLLSSLRNQTIRGYEIHMGTTTCTFPIFSDDGGQDSSGLVIGTYLHGLFHNENFRSAFLQFLRSKLSQERQALRQPWIKAEAGSQLRKSDSRPDPFDELAGVVKEHVDMETLYSIIGL